jgi:hypothetical protein
VSESFLKRLFGRNSQKPPVCRLTNAQALEIASSSVSSDTPLHVFRIEQTSDGIEWQIGTMTIGSGLSIRVDDRTGTIIECRPWGVR